MELDLYMKIKQDPKIYNLLKENSYYIKKLNRDSKYYENFQKEIKEKYKLRTTDKIGEVIDGIDMISTILETLK